MEGETTPGADSAGYVFPPPTLSAMAELFRALPTGMALISTDDRLTIAGAYLSVIRSGLAACLTPESYQMVSKDLEESLLESATESSRELMDSLALEPDNPTHAVYAKIAALVIQCDKFREFAVTITRGFVAARSESKCLEESFKEGWFRLNRERTYKAGRSKIFEMVSPGEFKTRIIGSENSPGFDLMPSLLRLVCVSFINLLWHPHYF